MTSDTYANPKQNADSSGLLYPIQDSCERRREYGDIIEASNASFENAWSVESIAARLRLIEYLPTHTPSSSNITYRISAAFSAKGRRFNTKKDLYNFDPARQTSVKQLPYTGRPASGQDAFFVSTVGNTSSVAFGVADGVGGWIESGVDPADFSHGLCRYLTQNARDYGEEKVGARQLLERGYNDIVADADIDAGGSTACVAVGDGAGNLQVANLGDSGFVQLRLRAVHHYSNPQTHAFNTPYQLSIIPPKILARSRIFGGMQIRDFPRDASVTDHEVRHGDVLVFATDGVWDNLSSGELLRIVERYMTHFGAWQNDGKGTVIGEFLADMTLAGGIPLEKENSLQTLLAVAITGEAKAASEDHRRNGPFAKEVRKYYPHEKFHGGKVDDICVVVAIAVDATQVEKCNQS
ncbi:MAG: hypothetical protein Q9219_006818 [cf. Caloplaca sp. 3 TL-2023]